MLIVRLILVGFCIVNCWFINFFWIVEIKCLNFRVIGVLLIVVVIVWVRVFCCMLRFKLKLVGVCLVKLICLLLIVIVSFMKLMVLIILLKYLG